jgi:BlaI family transcriptional regulator, penicillinase repressor
LLRTGGRRRGRAARQGLDNYVSLSTNYLVDMARKRDATLAPQELAVMKVVWRRGTATVRDVYEALRTTRPVAYTTVMTTMNILETKGFLQKKRLDRAYTYTPTRSRQQVVGAMVRDFVNRVFDGAAQPLMLHLAASETLSAQERAELRRLIDESASRDEEA